MKRNIIISTVLLLLMASCKNLLNKTDNRVTFENNANIDLHYLDSETYPDTIPNTTLYCNTNDVADIFSANTKEIIYSHTNWEDLCALNPNGVFIMYIYNRDTVVKYGCDSILRRKDLILKRFDITMDYLASHNWTLTYP